MTINTSEFEIGARGWLYRQWSGQFYPDDLPDEWRFSYYSNQFRTILVPAEFFCQSASQDIEDWAEYCDEEFRFYIECFSNTNWEHIKLKLACLNRHLSGIVIRSDKNSNTSPEAVKQLIGLALEMAPTYIDADVAGSIDIGDIPRLSNELGCVCEFEALQSDWVKPFKRSVVLISAASGQEPKQLRKMFDSFLSNDSLVVYSLFFAGSVPNIKDMETMQTIYTLWA